MYDWSTLLITFLFSFIYWKIETTIRLEPYGSQTLRSAYQVACIYEVFTLLSKIITTITIYRLQIMIFIFAKFEPILRRNRCQPFFFPKIPWFLRYYQELLKRQTNCYCDVHNVLISSDRSDSNSTNYITHRNCLFIYLNHFISVDSKWFDKKIILRRGYQP